MHWDEIGHLGHQSWGFDGSREFTRVVLSHPRQAGKTSRTQAIESRLKQLESELADIKRFGDDKYEDGEVLTFKGDFNGPKSFSYAAIKAAGRWHLTGGKAVQNATWEQLVDFMRGANVRKVRAVTATKRVV